MCKRCTVVLILIGMSAAVTLKAQNHLPATDDIPTTLVYEATFAINRGVDFLLSGQDKNGAWLESPAETALACLVVMNSPSFKDRSDYAKAVQRARIYMLKHVHKSGAITNSPTGNNIVSTAKCLLLLTSINARRDMVVMKKARRFLILSCLKKGAVSKLTGEELFWVLEALQGAEQLLGNDNRDLTKDQKLVHLLRASVLTALDKMQFKTGQDFSTGLVAYFYCGRQAKHARLEACRQWLTKNYRQVMVADRSETFQFAPLFFLTRALALPGMEQLEKPDGDRLDWRVDAIRVLLQKQQVNGGWCESRQESEKKRSVSATIFALMAMEGAMGKYL